jgi:hypothetical protein
MTDISVPLPKYDPQKHFAYFSEADFKSDDPDTAPWGLQVYSSVPFGEIHRTGCPGIEVALFIGYDGYVLHEDYQKRPDGRTSGKFTWYWSGSGLNVPYGSQYFPFASIPEKPGEYGGISPA